MKKNAVVTVTYGEDFKELSKVTHPSIKAYADKIDADFIVLDQLGDHKYPHFIKFDIRNLLFSYDRILYLDTDIIVRDDAPNIFNIVPSNKLGILAENPCEFRDPAFRKFLTDDLSQPINWNGAYYNTGVMVLSKLHSNLFELISDEIFHYGEQSYLNFNIARKNIPIYPLDWRFNRMNAHNEQTKEWRFTAYFIHYAAYLAPPNTAEIIKEIINKDLEILEKYKPLYKFPKNNDPKNGEHQYFPLETIKMEETLSNIVVGKDKVFFRDNTSDVVVIHDTLATENKQSEYSFPPGQAKIIFDIGANIGVTTLMLANRYPEATIYAFEPHPENFYILQKNTKHLPKVKTFNFGLYNLSSTLKLQKPLEVNNFASYSLLINHVSNEDIFAEFKSIKEFIASENILKIDIIKISCEGAEYDILTSIPKDILDNISWIEGKCNGVNDYDLLKYLSKTHNIGFNKKEVIDSKFVFQALNKKVDFIK